MTRTPSLVILEVGGSSIQSCEVVGDDVVLTTAPVPKDVGWLLAAPGVVEGDRVRGAHHIGWGDVSASAQLGMTSPPLCSLNDAHAAALGEWYLRGCREGRWLFIGLGTGVGSAVVQDGEVFDVDVSHATGFGPRVCGGCGAEGCLDAQIGGHALSDPLTSDDRERILGVLASAVRRLTEQPDAVILAGGLSRRYPELAGSLGQRISQAVHASAVESPHKSAAAWGLLHQWRTNVSSSTVPG